MQPTCLMQTAWLKQPAPLRLFLAGRARGFWQPVATEIAAICLHHASNRFRAISTTLLARIKCGELGPPLVDGSPLKEGTSAKSSWTLLPCLAINELHAK